MVLPFSNGTATLGIGRPTTGSAALQEERLPAQFSLALRKPVPALVFTGLIALYVFFALVVAVSDAPPVQCRESGPNISCRCATAGTPPATGARGGWGGLS